VGCAVVNTKNKRKEPMIQITKVGKQLIIGASLACSSLLLQPGTASAADISMANMKGAWQMTLAGQTGCGQSSMLANFTLNSSGKAYNMTLVSHGQCGDNTVDHLTFQINSLNSDGSGTASMSCGNDCGWNLMIQVNPERSGFNAVDVENPGNFVSGTAIRQK
jgi:hypothetical protein